MYIEDTILHRRMMLLEAESELIQSMNAAEQTTQEILDILRAIVHIQEQIAA